MVIIVAVDMVGYVVRFALVTFVISIGVYIVATVIGDLSTAIITKVVVVGAVRVFSYVIRPTLVTLVVCIGVDIVTAVIGYLSAAVIAEVVVVRTVRVLTNSRCATFVTSMIRIVIVTSVVCHRTTTIITKMVIIVTVCMVGHVIRSTLVTFVISIGVDIVATVIGYLTATVIAEVVVVSTVRVLTHSRSSTFVTSVVGVIIITPFVRESPTAFITEVIIVVTVDMLKRNRHACVHEIEQDRIRQRVGKPASADFNVDEHILAGVRYVKYDGKYSLLIRNIGKRYDRELQNAFINILIIDVEERGSKSFRGRAVRQIIRVEIQHKVSRTEVRILIQLNRNSNLVGLRIIRSAQRHTRRILGIGRIMGDGYICCVTVAYDSVSVQVVKLTDRQFNFGGLRHVLEGTELDLEEIVTIVILGCQKGQIYRAVKACVHVNELSVEERSICDLNEFK